MSILRLCLDRRVLAVLAAIAIGTAILAPQALGASLAVLLVAACPLSMVLMMAVMSRRASPSAPPSDVRAMRAELDALVQRQRLLERDLAASEQPSFGSASPRSAHAKLSD